MCSGFFILNFWAKVVQVLLAFGAIRRTHNNEVVQVVSDPAQPPLSQDPLTSVRHRCEDLRCRAQTKWQGSVNIYTAFPTHPEQHSVLRVDWHHPIGTSHINFRKERSLAQRQHGIYNVIHRYIRQGAQLVTDAVIDACPIWMRQIEDKAPLS